MIKSIKLSILFLLFGPITSICAQSILEVEITNLRNNKGFVAIELVDKHNKSIKGAKYKIQDKKCTIIFKDLKDREYAIRYFHDENSNDEVDKSFIGIPKEGVGFSNDAVGKFGPKKFEKWLFTVHGNTRLKLKTFYW